jgi:GLPGLI family protein
MDALLPTNYKPVRIIYLPLSFLVCILLFFSSCKRGHTPAGLNEGVIEYQIIYLQDKVGVYSHSVLPQSMTIQFKKNWMKTTIEGALGFFRLVNIADLHDLRNFTSLKFLDKKYIFMGEKKETSCCFGTLENMVIEYTGNTKEVAGFLCEEAIASFPDSGSESFTIYYTTDLKIKKPNATSPYYQIPGVMMEFNTTLGNATMRIIAKNFKSVRIPDKEFSIPDGYHRVSKKEIENILHALME